jgi:N4-(beta-N-acetylglucosaminyl)-L-asparaginase
MNRRNFLSLGTSFFASIPFLHCSIINTTQKPIVVSTWDAGMLANAAAWEVLIKNGKALDAVEKGVMVTEAEVNCCVGLGANPDREGIVTLDASIMDEKGNCGAVAFLEQIKHPVSVARRVMEKSPHVFLVGKGAQQFAIEQGFSLEKNELSANAKKSYEGWLKKSNYSPAINRENQSHEQSNIPLPTANENNHDTIGMIALDSSSNLSASCTTSGQGFKMRGRVGDAPIIGAGLFVDNEIGAAVATGNGEDVIRIAGCHSVIEFMRQGFTPEIACKKTVEKLLKLKGIEYCKTSQVCFIALNKNGVVGAYSLQKGFSYAVQSANESKLFKAKFLIT